MNLNSTQIKSLLQFQALRRAISPGIDKTMMLRQILSATLMALDSRWGYIFLFGEDNLTLAGKIPPSQTEQAIKEQATEALFSGRQSDTDLLIKKPHHLGAALWSERQNIGLLCVFDKFGNENVVPFVSNDETLLSVIAATASVGLEKLNADLEVERLKKQVPQNNLQSFIIGSSAKTRELLKQVQAVLDFSGNISVLIQGENGTGKELVAKAIRLYGPYSKSGNSHTVNCAVFTKELLRSELFGHKKGAFTGAVSNKRGLMELANNGVLFLDEIGDLDIELQSTLLRALDGGTFRRVGDEQELYSDFQLVCATNRNLKEAVEKGTFRRDLYYRLTDIIIEVPPLRERRGDIAELISYFLEKYNKEFNKNIKGFTRRAIHRLEQHPWEGNVRELESMVKKGMIHATGSHIDVSELSNELQGGIGEALEFNQILPLKDAVASYVDFAYNRLDQHTTHTMQKLEIDYRQLMRHLGKRIDEHMVFDLKDGVELDIAKRAEEIMRHADIPDEKCRGMKRALIEAVVNALEHSKSKIDKLKVDIEITSRLVKVMVKDLGTGFNPDVIPDVDPNLKIVSRVKRGWGIYLMKKSVDSLKIDSSSSGTTVTMTINR
ncbi:MAG: sigma 54-interacting transcriptional regulator [Calditrichia bacterium]